MKLYEFSLAPGPRRVRMFIAEKGIEIPDVQINTRERQQFTDEYRAVNPNCVVPTLVLDDGTAIGESVAICRYLEDLHPEPVLFGRTAEERAVIDMWMRRFELDGFIPLLHAMRNHVPTFAGRVVPGTRTDLPQLPAMVTRGKEMMEIFLGRIEPHMARNEFVAGAAFSVADITGFFTLRLAAALQMDVDSSHPAVAAWFARVSARPAFQL